MIDKMYDKKSGWEKAGRMALRLDNLTDMIVRIILVFVLIFAAYCLYDTWSVYNHASDRSILKYKPGTEEDGYSFKDLLKLNPDVKAWITVNDTNIDYPITQSEDNEKYLNTDVLGEYSLTGSIFLDFRNSDDFMDPYSIVYGHHMDQNIMFGGLDLFYEEQYFLNHRTGSLYLPNDETYEITFFAVVKTNAHDENIYLPLNDKEEGVRELRDKMLKGVVDKSEQLDKDSISLLNDNLDIPVIALSTCSNATTNERTLLIGYVNTGKN